MNDHLGKLLLIAFVLGFGALIWRAVQISRASPHWPYVEGEITRSAVVARNESGDAHGVPTHMWDTQVGYRYSVNGTVYQGDRLRAFGRRHFSEQEAQAELEPYRVGARVRIYYDPGQPSSSVLIPG